MNRMLPRLAALSTLVALMFFGSKAHADTETESSPQDAPPPKGFHTHDGFFLRMGYGLGYQSASASADGVDLSIGGVANNLTIAMGGAVAENVIVHAEVFGGTAPGPTIQSGRGLAKTGDDVKITFAGIGPGMTVYNSANTFISGSVGLGRIGLSQNGEMARTNFGVGCNLLFGKEWWVSQDWGLGLAGQFYYFSVKEDPNINWSGAGGGITLTATYN